MSHSLAVTHLREIPRGFNLKHPIMSKQYIPDNMNTPESFAVFLERRRNRNHVLGLSDLSLFV